MINCDHRSHIKPNKTEKQPKSQHYKRIFCQIFKNINIDFSDVTLDDCKTISYFDSIKIVRRYILPADMHLGNREIGYSKFTLCVMDY